MKKAILVIISNGRTYSDHRHWVACSCATRQDAEKIVENLTDWFKNATIAYDNDELRNFMVNNKPIVWGATSEDLNEDYFNPTNYVATIIEVPEWAERLK